MDSRLHETYVQAVLAERHLAAAAQRPAEDAGARPRRVRRYAADRLARMADRLADGPVRHPTPPRATGVR
jgi:hypothetical protein